MNIDRPILHYARKTIRAITDHERRGLYVRQITVPRPEDISQTYVLLMFSVVFSRSYAASRRKIRYPRTSSSSLFSVSPPGGAISLSFSTRVRAISAATVSGLPCYSRDYYRRHRKIRPSFTRPNNNNCYVAVEGFYFSLTPARCTRPP